MEDGYFVALPFAGVMDGVSEPYYKNRPQVKFRDERLTGGEVISRITEGFFIQQSIGKDALDLDLRDLVLGANKLVKEEFEAHGFSLDRPERLAGATFAIAKMGEIKVELVQAGDCFALWVTTGGEIGITPNQVRQHDTEYNDLIEKIQRRIAKEKYNLELEKVISSQSREIREEMWLEFNSIWEKGRARDVNNPSSPSGYGLLNGQAKLKEMLFHKIIQRDNLNTLLLFTDGIVPWETMKDKNDIEIARTVYATYEKGGLPELLP